MITLARLSKFSIIKVEMVGPDLDTKRELFSLLPPKIWNSESIVTRVMSLIWLEILAMICTDQAALKS